MMEESPSFFFFFPPFCSRHVNNPNQAAPAIVSHPTNLMATKKPRGSEGQTGGASQSEEKQEMFRKTSPRCSLVDLCCLSPTSQRKQQLLALVTSASESLCFPPLQVQAGKGTRALPSASLSPWQLTLPNKSRNYIFWVWFFGFF